MHKEKLMQVVVMVCSLTGEIDDYFRNLCRLTIFGLNNTPGWEGVSPVNVKLSFKPLRVRNRNNQDRVIILNRCEEGHSEQTFMEALIKSVRVADGRRRITARPCNSFELV